MCFSPQADLVGGAVVGTIGIDVLRHLNGRRNYVMIAALPVLLAAHQLDESFVWWGLQGQIDPVIGRVATWIYLLIAFVVLPTYIPIAVILLEPRGKRRYAMAVFVAIGVAVSAVLLDSMLQNNISTNLAKFHISYSVVLSAGMLDVAAYVASTCGALLFSSHRKIAIYGAVNLVVVALLAKLAVDGFASLWCAWAAITSGALALYLRFGERNTAPVLLGFE